MFIALLLVTFAIAAATSFVVARAFHNPVAVILARIVPGELALAWQRYVVFAVYLVGINGGVRIWELEKSFAFLRASLTATTQAKLGEQVSLFGQKFSGQQTWIMTATHLHEHLGQMIAYARANGVTPPWSQGG